MRLDKFLSNMGKGTRTEIKKEIMRGHVFVNGECVKKVGFAIREGEDKVVLNQEEIGYEKYVYLMLNKPKDVISATEDPKHKTVIDLVKSEYGNRKLFPVGRLDIDTEGLLLLTDDGQFNHELMAPKKHVEKTYFATVLGHVDQQTVAAFKKGVTIDDGYLCKAADLALIKTYDDSSDIFLTITEGKFHQVKRMFEAVEMQVTYLKRVRIGNLQLDETLQLGDYRALTENERKKIKP